MNAEELNIKIEKNAALAPYTSFQIGGSCRTLYHCQTSEELQHVIKELHESEEPYILIGGGSNLLVSDQGVDCHVIRFVSEKPIIELNGADMTVSGSSNLDEVVLYAAENGLEGLNYASGIPGTVGGAVLGNAGAFGQQVGDVLKFATLLKSNGHIRVAFKDELEFSYRNSKLKETGEIVLEVVFGLSKGNRDDLIAQRNEWLKLREEKHPDLIKDPCAGSIFRNIEPTSKADKRQAAAHYLEEAGAKTLHLGNAEVFAKHANIIINKDKKATAQDVYELSNQMKSVVKEKFNLDLIREVQLVGNFDNMPDNVKDVIW